MTFFDDSVVKDDEQIGQRIDQLTNNCGRVDSAWKVIFKVRVKEETLSF
jgi:hypothetical protein